MIALNNTSIFVGQIKQILKEFNLPLCRIGNKNLYPNSYYIDNNKIYYYYLDKVKNAPVIVPCSDYIYNTPYLNITANFKLDNMIYDRPTHQYLGKYLRFLRDYNRINLMSMYNCFDGTALEYDISFSINNKLIEFNSNSKEYIVYKIPISLVDIYSISIHNTKNIELCLYDEKDNIKDNTDPNKYNLSINTYKKLKINNVFHYEIGKIDIPVSNELYMLLKVPKDLNTSIVVLEGKYYDKYNNLNILPYGNITRIQLKIAAQLLSTQNTYNNYLLADRLVEYLTGSVIYRLSEPYDIKRMQVTLDRLYSTINPPLPAITKRIYGIWNDDDLELIKYIAIKNDLIRYDSLGYIDKDIENYFIANTDFDFVNIDYGKEG